MVVLTKKEIFRIRKVNEMKRIANSSENYKVAYFPGGNFVLLKKLKKRWVLKEQTGVWYEPLFDKVQLQ